MVDIIYKYMKKEDYLGAESCWDLTWGLPRDWGGPYEVHIRKLSGLEKSVVEFMKQVKMYKIKRKKQY